jgi:hypothetical protein
MGVCYGNKQRRSMGKYTALDDPIVDQTIEEHMQQIVAAIRSRVEPQAIILRGSFSQGEGSVVIGGNRLRFLSDYEVMAVTPHYRHRRWLRTVARQMTAELGVETSISRVHPHNIERNSLGNLPTGGIACPTIAMYEVQSGGITLYGEHLLNRGPAIDPCTLNIWAGLRLILNRMAESLNHLSSTKKDWEELRWVNKTILSCAEALLIVHGQYHFSYAERGRRFADLVSELDTAVVQASHLPDLVCRATAFKLRPSLDLYPEPISVVWQRVRQACDATLRYVIERYLGFSFSSYAEFPERYLNQLVMQNRLGKSRLGLLPAPLAQNLFLILKLLRARRFPPASLITYAPYPAYQVVFSVIPLVFLGGDDGVLRAARRWLERVSRLDAPRPAYEAEWDYLQGCTVQAWKDYCYGLWDAI